MDKIESVIQAAVYKKKENDIDLKEWIEYAWQNICTTLGKQLLDFLVESLCIN